VKERGVCFFVAFSRGVWKGIELEEDWGGKWSVRSWCVVLWYGMVWYGVGARRSNIIIWKYQLSGRTNRRFVPVMKKRTFG
jgi:hypothetical protein